MGVSIDQPAPIRQGEELAILQLEAYLRKQLPAADNRQSKGRQSKGRLSQGQLSNAPLTIEQFPSGYSNLTYLLRMGENQWVLRRPPFGNIVQSAHDMGREFRVLSKLADVYPPAPRALLYCEDEAIIGSPFYIMQRCGGVILRKDRAPEQLAEDPVLVKTLCESFVDGLVQLHRIDYQAAGLGDLGRPQGYVERQVTGWSKRYADAQTDDYPEFAKITDWLADHMPSDNRSALIHNDYKYDNLVLDPSDLTNIVGVLDWEMATIGDPLMDLGTTLAYWIEPDDAEEEKLRAFGPTMLTGSMSRQQLVERYAHTADIGLPEIVFYYAFGLFKLAVIVQQIYARYAAGKTQDERFANLNKMVQSLGKRGLNVTESGKI